MPDWSVKIEGKPAVFTPDIEDLNVKPGTPLQVVQGDLVSWDNESDEAHFLVPDHVPNGPQFSAFMTAPLTPGNPSRAYNIVAPSGTTISYHCSLHDNEHGKIVVVDFGATDYGTDDLTA
jgi:plastocyanin